MTDITQTTDDLFWDRAYVLVGTYGEQPTDEIGYKDREKGCEVTMGFEEIEHSVEEYAGAVAIDRTPNKFEAAIDLRQITSTTLAYALGISSSTLMMGGGRSSQDPYSARLVGSLRNKRPLHVHSPRVVSVGGDMSMAFKVTEDVGLPFAYRALDGSGGLAQWSIGTAAQTLTLATGVATYVKCAADKDIAWAKLTSEDTSADTITSIVGSVALAAADDGRIIRIQPATALAITVTHATNAIELKGAEDIVLDQTSDWIDLYFVYDETNPKWVEICHYLAP